MRISCSAVATYLQTPFILGHIGRTVRTKQAILDQVDVSLVAI
jgi:hypothetical protein